MTQQNIVTLILSLTPSEKQHFKKSNDSNSDFVLLFDYINKTKAFQNSEANKYLNKKKNKSQKDSKTYTSGHLSVIKNYLHEKIMESLRIQYTPKRPSYEIMSRVINADILLEKGLYNLAKSEIDQAKKKSEYSVFPIEKLILYRRESLIQFYSDYVNYNINDIEALFVKRIETAAQLTLEVKYAKAIALLTHQYFQGEKDLTVVDKILAEDYMQDKSLPKEFATKYLFYWVHSQCAEFKNQPNEAIEFFEKAIRPWIENPEYIKAHPRMYLSTCYTYLKFLLQEGKSEQIILKETDLKLLISKIPKLQLPKDVALKWEQLFVIGQLIALKKEHSYEDIISLENQLLEIISDSNFTTDFTRILIYYILSTAYFQQKNYKKSNDLILSLLHNEEIELRSNPEYFNHVYLIYITGLYELKNFKFLKSELPKIKQILKTHHQLKAFEEFYIKMIGQLISKKFEKEPQRVFDRFSKRLTKALKQDNSSQNVEYQLITDWLENRMNYNK